MKTIIYAYQETESFVNYEGQVAKLFFTTGCNFRCGFCHNPDFTKNHDATISKEQLENILKKAKTNWVKAVCISGGEPTIHPELPELINYFKQKGFLVKLDTNGSNPDMLASLTETVDYFAMDYKTRLAKYSNIARVEIDPNKIQQSIEILTTQAEDYELRTTVLPEIHTLDDFQHICQEIQGVKKYILQPFVPRDTHVNESYSKKLKTKDEFMNECLQLCTELLPDTEVKIR